jgi:glycosyltransferase involved in cell wall biosynthesis
VAFEKERADQLADCVASLAADRQRAMQMGSEGKALHGRDYTVEAMAERIEKVYSTRSANHSGLSSASSNF